jgi:UPF0176 protein
MNYLNIAAYKFITLTELPTLRTVLKSRASEQNLYGTILLSEEGINLMLAGLPENINAFRSFLENDSLFSDLSYKESYSTEMTYNRLLVKIKKEIISFNIEKIDPVKTPAPYIESKMLKSLLDNDGDVVLLDTRNDYEVVEGSFENAIHLNIQQFTQFPAAIEQLESSFKEKTIITFCTGGIRCEKAAIYMLQQGFKNVCQLKGGILEYFKECGSAHYQGQCFVFDKRNAVNEKLDEV